MPGTSRADAEAKKPLLPTIADQIPPRLLLPPPRRLDSAPLVVVSVVWPVVVDAVGEVVVMGVFVVVVGTVTVVVVGAGGMGSAFPGFAFS